MSKADLTQERGKTPLNSLAETEAAVNTTAGVSVDVVTNKKPVKNKRKRLRDIISRY